MILRCSTLALGAALFSSTTTTTTTTTAFVTQTPASRVPWTTNGGMVQKAIASNTALQMGIFEDFLSGQDASARDKENVAYLKNLEERVSRINALEPETEELDDDELEAKTEEFKKRLADGEDINGKLLEEAFAVVREASWCVLLYCTVLVCIQ